MKKHILLPLSLLAACGAAFAQGPATPPAASLLEPESALQETPKRREEFLTPLTSQVVEPASNMQTGVSIDRYIGEPDKSPARRWRNVMFVQNILRSGDPDPARPGNPGAVLAEDGGDAEAVLASIAAAGIDLDALAGKLQRDGAAAFVRSWTDLLACLAAKAA